MTAPNFVLSDRLQLAFERAVELHRNQGRKGSRVPYVGHLLSVAGIVLEDGGSEDEAIAGLLHDAIEDQFSEGLADSITRDFGEHVTQIVEGCSQDNQPGEDLPSRTRKERYIRALQDAPREVLRVSLADKLCNVRSMLRDHREVGDALWERFAVDGETLLWYYETLSRVYLDRRAGATAEEFADEVERLRIVLANGTAP